MPSFDTNAFKDRAQGLLSGFSVGQRAVVIVAVIGLIAGGFMFTSWVAKPSMVPLFSQLSTEDAAAMTAELDSQGVKYELGAGGSTILVPQKDVYQLRLTLAGEGLTAGDSEGYSLLDNQGSSITQSQSAEALNMRRALEGELNKTIGSIDGIKGANVHLVVPEEDVFSEDNVKPTASVLVTTAQGKSLSSQTVQSIVNLVAGSVEGLSTDDVTVADSSGRLLSADGAAGGSGTDQQNQQTAALETELNNKIQTLLTPLVGQGKAVVQTRAELNWDKSKSVSQVYNPTNKTAAVGSETINSEIYGAGAGGGDAATGCIGTDTPVNGVCTPAQGGTGATGDGGYNNTQTTKDYLQDQTQTETEVAVGQPERITVSVLLDSSVANIDPTAIENLVNNAAGLQVARGDSVQVESLPFDASAADAAGEAGKEAEAAASKAAMMDYIKIGVTAVIILAVLAILFITTKRRAKLYQSTPVSMAELDAAMPALGGSADDLLDSLEAPMIIDTSPEALERAKVDREITDLIEKQPDEVATLLRGWLADRRG